MKCGFQSEAWHCVHLTCEAHDSVSVSQSVQINMLPVFKPQTALYYAPYSRYFFFFAS